MERNDALEELIKLTNQKIGYILATPSDFNQLHLEIKKKLGTTISVSSIKRIWGYVEYDGFPSVSTLNTLARFNDIPGWLNFLADTASSNADESAFLTGTAIDTNSLNFGDLLEICWGSNKGCFLECIGNKRFRVLKSSNIKLQPFDTLTLHSLSVGHPIYATEIYRDKLLIPAYIGAKNGGVSFINKMISKNEQ